MIVPQGNTPPPPAPPSTPLTLGSIVNESIAVTGEQDRYTFTLDSASLLYFDSRTNDSRFQWTLTGPAGTAVSARAFTSSDGFGVVNPLNLVAGDYTLTVAASGSTTGAYSFRLSDPSAATGLALATRAMPWADQRCAPSLRS